MVPKRCPSLYFACIPLFSEWLLRNHTQLPGRKYTQRSSRSIWCIFCWWLLTIWRGRRFCYSGGFCSILLQQSRIWASLGRWVEELKSSFYHLCRNQRIFIAIRLLPAWRPQKVRVRGTLLSGYIIFSAIWQSEYTQNYTEFVFGEILKFFNLKFIYLLLQPLKGFQGILFEEDFTVDSCPGYFQPQFFLEILLL